MGQSIVTHARIGRDHLLTRALVDQGCSSEAARVIVNLIFDAIKNALKRHETVELPIGTFKVVKNRVRPYRMWHFGRPIEFYRQPYRVEFTPSREMD